MGRQGLYIVTLAPGPRTASGPEHHSTNLVGQTHDEWMDEGMMPSLCCDNPHLLFPFILCTGHGSLKKKNFKNMPYFIFFLHNCIYLFIFGRAGSLLLLGFFSSGVWGLLLWWLLLWSLGSRAQAQ